MTEQLTATSSTVIDAAPTRVWAALMDPDLASQAFFGSKVDTDWQVGSKVTFSGEWQGRSFEDTGEVLRAEPGHLLEFTHFSPLTGQPDVPENYHHITIELTPRDGGTEVALRQTNAASEEERKHSEDNWAQFLASLKRVSEG
jgi:uncharacterized protein YndB with AHSA1/START domain